MTGASENNGQLNGAGGDLLRHALGLTDRRITEIIGHSDKLVLRYIEDYAGNRGKLLRPRLILSFSELFGGAPLHSLTNCAACCELLHMATLIHDDVIDEADTRRAQSTLNSRYGNEIAVIVGDYVLALMLRAINEERDYLLNDMLLATSQELGMGVIEEIINRNNFSMSVEKYYEVINLKTAVLFSLCCRIGAYLGHAPMDVVNLAGSYGKYLGLSFQIVDDLLDLTQEQSSIGKPPLNDVREGRITLPVIHAYEQDAEKTKQLVHDFQQNESDEAGAALKAHLAEHKSIEFAYSKALGFLEHARTAVSEFRGNIGDESKLDMLSAIEERIFKALPESIAAKHSAQALH